MTVDRYDESVPTQVPNHFSAKLLDQGPKSWPHSVVCDNDLWNATCISNLCNIVGEGNENERFKVCRCYRVAMVVQCGHEQVARYPKQEGQSPT